MHLDTDLDTANVKDSDIFEYGYSFSSLRHVQSNYTIWKQDNIYTNIYIINNVVLPCF